MNNAKRLLQQSPRVVHSAERCLCFRYVGKDRVSFFLLQIEIPVFLHEFLHCRSMLSYILYVHSMKQCLYFRYAGKDKGKILFRMPKNAKAFHRIAIKYVLFSSLIEFCY